MLGAQTLKGTDDYECLRFLRARKFKLADALELYNNYKSWYAKNNIASTLKRVPPKQDLLRKMVFNLFPLCAAVRRLFRCSDVNYLTLLAVAIFVSP